MSNFTFLADNWPDLYATAREAEQNVTSTPLSHQTSFYTRRSLEIAVKRLYANDSYSPRDPQTAETLVAPLARTHTSSGGFVIGRH